jgi:hypothetical protein
MRRQTECAIWSQSGSRRGSGGEGERPGELLLVARDRMAGGPSERSDVVGSSDRARANTSSMSGLASATQPSVQSRPWPPSPWISIRLPIPAWVGTWPTRLPNE